VTSLPPERQTRLAKLLGMLGSAHIGERAAAAAMADQLIREHGLTWSDVLGGSPSERAPETPPNWRTQIAEILSSGRATPWESQFCTRLDREWTGDLTPKQRQVLDKIFNQRVKRAA
jgi:hypothetical protein